MAKRKHVMTAARRAALRKAQLASAAKRHAKAARQKPTVRVGRRGVTSKSTSAFQPNIRISRRSQTLSTHAGVVIPGTNRRLVAGGYVRVENIKKRSSLVDQVVGKQANKIIDKAYKRPKRGGRNNAT